MSGVVLSDLSSNPAVNLSLQPKLHVAGTVCECHTISFTFMRRSLVAKNRAKIWELPARFKNLWKSCQVIFKSSGDTQRMGFSKKENHTEGNEGKLCRKRPTFLCCFKIPNEQTHAQYLLRFYVSCRIHKPHNVLCAGTTNTSDIPLRLGRKFNYRAARTAINIAWVCIHQSNGYLRV